MTNLAVERECSTVLGQPQNAGNTTTLVRSQRTLLVGGDGIPAKEFLSRPVTDRLQP